MKSRIFIFGVVLALVGCESGSVETPAPNGTPITFNFQQEKPEQEKPEWPTRAAQVETLTKIGMFGYSHPAAGGWAAASLTNPTADYFLNRPIINSGSGWGYDGVVKYWPDDSKRLSFFAYAPYSYYDPNIKLFPTTALPKGKPRIEFTTETDVLKQVDLMWCAKPDQSNGLLAFQMTRALAHIEFQIDFSGLIGIDDAFKTIKFEKLTLMGVNTNGVLDLSNGRWEISTNSEDINKMELYPNRGLISTDFKFADFTEELTATPMPISGEGTTGKDGFLMLIPQELNNDPRVILEMSVIDFEDKYIPATEVFTISVDKRAIKANSNYKFVIKMGSADEIKALFRLPPTP